MALERLTEPASLNLLPQPCQSSVQQPLHRHGTHLQLPPKLAVAGPFEHHLAHHVALAGVEKLQHRFQARLRLHVLAIIRPVGQRFEPPPVAGQRPPQPAQL